MPLGDELSVLAERELHDALVDFLTGMFKKHEEVMRQGYSTQEAWAIVFNLAKQQLGL